MLGCCWVCWFVCWLLVAGLSLLGYSLVSLLLLAARPPVQPCLLGLGWLLHFLFPGVSLLLLLLGFLYGLLLAWCSSDWVGFVAGSSFGQTVCLGSLLVGAHPWFYTRLLLALGPFSLLLLLLVCLACSMSWLYLCSCYTMFRLGACAACC